MTDFISAFAAFVGFVAVVVLAAMLIGFAAAFGKSVYDDVQRWINRSKHHAPTP